MPDHDSHVRLRAFQFLQEQCHIYGETLPRRVLEEGFIYEGVRVPMIGPQGIFKPAILPVIPLTFTTVPIIEGQSGLYEDELGNDGLIRYRYRGTDPQHRDNVGMRRARQPRVPLIYLYGVVPGRYIPVWPAYVVGDDPATLTFKIEIGEKVNLTEAPDE